MLKNIQNEMAKYYEYVVLFLLMSKFNKLSAIGKSFMKKLISNSFTDWVKCVLLKNAQNSSIAECLLQKI